MKAAQRAPYLAAVEASMAAVSAGQRAGYTILCASCRFFTVSPTGDYGGPPDVDCDHPLSAIRERGFERAWEGGDCWGFRPKKAAP